MRKEPTGRHRCGIHPDRSSIRVEHRRAGVDDARQIKRCRASRRCARGVSRFGQGAAQDQNARVMMNHQAPVCIPIRPITLSVPNPVFSWKRQKRTLRGSIIVWARRENHSPVVLAADGAVAGLNPDNFEHISRRERPAAHVRLNSLGPVRTSSAREPGDEGVICHLYGTTMLPVMGPSKASDPPPGTCSRFAARSDHGGRGRTSHSADERLCGVARHPNRSGACVHRAVAIAVARQSEHA